MCPRLTDLSKLGLKSKPWTYFWSIPLNFPVMITFRSFLQLKEVKSLSNKVYNKIFSLKNSCTKLLSIIFTTLETNILPVLLSYCYCNELSRTKWLKTTQMYLAVLEVRSA